MNHITGGEECYWAQEGKEGVHCPLCARPRKEGDVAETCKCCEANGGSPGQCHDGRCGVLMNALKNKKGGPSKLSAATTTF